VIGRERHLQEERLFDLYLAAGGGEPIDPPVAEHLADCAACAARYAELSTFMDSLRDAGEAEADAVFTAERLRAQQHEIARRIALVGRPARVISFPTRLVRRTIGASTSRTVPRWTAAAAAAGLFVGVAVGASYQWGAGTPPAAAASPTMRHFSRSSRSPSSGRIRASCRPSTR
jgi:anti-sigma factor RsiW